MTGPDGNFAPVIVSQREVSILFLLNVRAGRPPVRMCYTLIPVSIIVLLVDCASHFYGSKPNGRLAIGHEIVRAFSRRNRHNSSDFVPLAGLPRTKSMTELLSLTKPW